MTPAFTSSLAEDDAAAAARTPRVTG
jgi:hypothetical protein